MKKCTKCKEVKPLDAFYKDNGSKSGYQSWCKTCKSPNLEMHIKKREKIRSLLEEGKKRCSNCGAEKQLNQFYQDNHRKDGRQGICKTCMSDIKRKYINANRERIIETRRNYREVNRDKLAEARRKYRESNKEKIIERQKKYRELNVKKIADNNRKYYKENKTKLSKKRRVYFQNNKDKRYVISARRRAKEKYLPATLTSALWNEILNNTFEGACSLTSRTDDIHIEHFIPISWGHGGTTPENCYPLCGELNLSKQNKNPFEWIKDYSEYQERFNKLVKHLAEKNNMNEQEFKDYVYWCESNKVNIEANEH